MTIFCKICRRDFSSIQPDLEAAETDVLEQMGKHLIADHPKERAMLAEDIGFVMRLLATYLMTKKHVRIPESEKQLLQSFDAKEAQLMSIFELEPLPAEKSN